MALCVRKVNSTQVMSQLFELRQLSIDEYDLNPSTNHFAIFQENRVVGASRFVPLDLSMPMNDFNSPYLEAAKNMQSARAAVWDLFHLEESIANRKTIFLMTLKMALLEASHLNLTQIFCSLPRAVFDFTKIAGLSALISLNEDDSANLIPCSIDINEYNQDFLGRIKDREINKIAKLFYYTYFNPGDIVIVEGEKGSTSYLIETGEVEIVKFQNQKIISVKSIGPGQLVGEIAMITNQNRTASIVAKTHTLALAFDREAFVELIYREPFRSIDMFKLFAKRIYEVNRQANATLEDLK